MCCTHAVHWGFIWGSIIRNHSLTCLKEIPRPEEGPSFDRTFLINIWQQQTTDFPSHPARPLIVSCQFIFRWKMNGRRRKEKFCGGGVVTHALRRRRRRCDGVKRSQKRRQKGRRRKERRFIGSFVKPRAKKRFSPLSLPSFPSLSISLLPPKR